MPDLITCPRCAHSFEATAALREQIERDLRRSLSEDTQRQVARAAEAARAEAAARLQGMDGELRDARTKLEEAARQQAEYLVEQADYTEALAKKEAALLAPWGIAKATLDTLADLKSKLNAATKDRALASADAQSATTSQNEAFAKGKSWLRKAILIGQNAYDDDGAQSDEFTKGGNPGNSVPKLSEKMKKVIGLLKRDTSTTSKFGATTAFLKEGDDILASLSSADATQEHKKADLPKGTRDFHVQKAQLYFLLKRINRAGRAAHVDDPEAAGRYNLSILHRRGAARKGKEEAVGAGTA